MISVSQALKISKMQNRKALIPYLTAGFPDERLFVRLLKEFAKMGADLLEIGIPFSDPLADGRSIQFSSQKALEDGITIDKTFDLLRGLDLGHGIPLILMSYYNPILSYGVSRFARNARRAGASGLIIPDMIPEEGISVEKVCRGSQLDLIYLLAPTSSSQRRRNIIRRSRGFVYLVSVTGVTGQRNELPTYLNSWIRRVREESSLPVCVGFGISNGRQARSVCRAADGVIVGSAVIEAIKKEKSSKQIIERTRKFIRSLREGMDGD